MASSHDMSLGCPDGDPRKAKRFLMPIPRGNHGLVTTKQKDGFPFHRPLLLRHCQSGKPILGQSPVAIRVSSTADEQAEWQQRSSA